MDDSTIIGISVGIGIISLLVWLLFSFLIGGITGRDFYEGGGNAGIGAGMINAAIYYVCLILFGAIPFAVLSGMATYYLCLERIALGGTLYLVYGGGLVGAFLLHIMTGPENRIPLDEADKQRKQQKIATVIGGIIGCGIALMLCLLAIYPDDY